MEKKWKAQYCKLFFFKTKTDNRVSWVQNWSFLQSDEIIAVKNVYYRGLKSKLCFAYRNGCSLGLYARGEFGLFCKNIRCHQFYSASGTAFFVPLKFCQAVPNFKTDVVLPLIRTIFMVSLTSPSFSIFTA